MLTPSIEALQRRLPTPTRIEAAAILRAYSETAVPLPLQDAARWYAVGGDYWRVRWMVCGWTREGDRMLDPKAAGWGFLMSSTESRDLWSMLAALAEDSDRWQLAQGTDTLPPTVDVAALMRWDTRTLWEQVTMIGPLWRRNDRAPRNLARFIAESYKRLQEWRRTRRPGQTPTRTDGPGGGMLLLLAAVAILGSSRRRKK
jgi:MYXO-CTERM domain-containing protein